MLNTYTTNIICLEDPDLTMLHPRTASFSVDHAGSIVFDLCGNSANISAYDIDAQDTSAAVLISRYAEFAKCVTALVEINTDSFADFISPVLRVVASPHDSEEVFGCIAMNHRRGALSRQCRGHVRNRFCRMQSVEVDIDFISWGCALVSIFVKMTCGRPVRISHKVVLGLSTQAQGFCCTNVVPVPGLRSAISSFVSKNSYTECGRNTFAGICSERLRA